MNWFPLIFHVTACIWYIFFWTNFLSIYGRPDSGNPIFQNIMDMGYRYLTNWNLFFQTLFFAGCLFHDVMKMLNGPNWLKLGSKFQACLSLAFSSILLPLGIFVCITFWVMFTIDREIIYPKIIDTYIPFWQNHGMHTTILPLILFELFTTQHKFPSISVSLAILVAFGSLYTIVFFETYFEKGRWAYPLFGFYSFPISVAIMIVLSMKQILCLFVGIFIQNMYWGKVEKKNDTENRFRNQII